MKHCRIQFFYGLSGARPHTELPPVKETTPSCLTYGQRFPFMCCTLQSVPTLHVYLQVSSRFFRTRSVVPQLGFCGNTFHVSQPPGIHLLIELIISEVLGLFLASFFCKVCGPTLAPSPFFTLFLKHTEVADMSAIHVVIVHYTSCVKSSEHLSRLPYAVDYIKSLAISACCTFLNPWHLHVIVCRCHG